MKILLPTHRCDPRQPPNQSLERPALRRCAAASILITVLSTEPQPRSQSGRSLCLVRRHSRPMMKHFWRVLNTALLIFCAWTGYWTVAPERVNDRGFIRSDIPVGPDYPPITFSCLAIFLMLGIFSFVTFRRACRKGSSFRWPGWDRNPFRELSDPIQALVIPLIALLTGTVVATLRFLFGPTLGAGAIIFLWSWDIGIVVGALIAYAIYRPRIVIA